MPGGIILPEQATPSTPAAGYSVIYPKADGQWYFKDDAGVEHPLAGTGISETIFDAKGDILTATAADTPARLAVGADGLFLKADSSQATGLIWAALTAGSQSVAGIWEAATQAEADAGTANRVPTTDLNKLVLETLQATTSGSTKDFTGIPSGTRLILFYINGVSTNGTTGVGIQLGDSGGPETTGYNGGVINAPNASSPTVVSSSSFFSVVPGGSASVVGYGLGVLGLIDAATNLWACFGGVFNSGTTTMNIFAGTKALTAELDRIRFITGNGTDTFDAGSVNIAHMR